MLDIRFRSHARRSAVALLALLCLFGGQRLATAQEAEGLPPLLDRELFFGDPEIAGAQISPDGKFIAFIKPLDGTRNIWVKRTEEPFDAARPVTADTRRPIPAYFWSRDSRYLLFVQDEGGDENFNVYAVDPAASPAEGARAPAARNLTDAKGVRALIYAVPRSQPGTLYVGLNDRDAAWHDLHRIDIATGERTLLRQNTERLTGWVFDLKDQLRLATRSAENGDTEVLRVDEGGFTRIYTCTVFETCNPVRFHRNGKQVYMISNKGDTDLARLVLVDVQSGAETVVESDPEKRVDIAGTIFSELSDTLLATVYVDDRRRIQWKDKAFEADYELVRRKLPDAQVNFASSTRDERLYLVTAVSDVEPGQTFLFDRQTKQLTPQYRIREALPREHLAPMTTIRYPSSDGLEIPAYLTLPRGVPAKQLPVIVVPHGGPWARDMWGYNGFAQFLANRGYAVLQPNFRGSTGFGKAFLDAGNNQWGDKMQDDLTWGVRHLIEKGLADPKRVGIMGGSYGGYATLAGLAFTPDVYAAGVSIVGPSNLLTLLESIPPYWEPVRTLFHQRMGDPSVPEQKAQLERQSPLNSAHEITSPLLVVQGANDPRVRKAESDQIVVALRERGFPVEYLVAPDEGHGFARPINNLALFAAAEAFLAKHLNGRFQKEMTPETARRLEEITVDPKTVDLPKQIETSAITAPSPVAGLTPGTFAYAARIEMGGQKVEMALSREVSEETGRWVIVETATTPQGDATDRTVLDKGSLQLRQRSITQGPISVELNVDGDKATGTMAMGGSAQPIDVALEGPLFADGAGAALAIAALPLAEGYTVAYRNLDLMTRTVKVVQLAVDGSEEVSVPAGSFDAWRVKLSSPDDGATSTVWVAKDSRKVVKTSAVNPRMNGATITSELQQ
jgi:dipeptidyl aminopeptidase/acylaminoacyl peptidase